MTTAQVVETSVVTVLNSPVQDYTLPDDHMLPTYEMTLDFKPFKSSSMSLVDCAACIWKRERD